MSTDLVEVTTEPIQVVITATLTNYPAKSISQTILVEVIDPNLSTQANNCASQPESKLFRPNVEPTDDFDISVVAEIGKDFSFQLPVLSRSDLRYDEVNIGPVIQFMGYSEATQTLTIDPSKTSPAQ